VCACVCLCAYVSGDKGGGAKSLGDRVVARFDERGMRVDQLTINKIAATIMPLVCLSASVTPDSASVSLTPDSASIIA
jgi:hypothetical protein